MCKELRVKRDQASCYSPPPFLGTPLAPSRKVTFAEGVTIRVEPGARPESRLAEFARRRGEKHNIANKTQQTTKQQPTKKPTQTQQQSKRTVRAEARPAGLGARGDRPAEAGCYYYYYYYCYFTYYTYYLLVF